MRRGIEELRERVAAAAAPERLSPPLALAAFAFGLVAWALHHVGVPFALESGDAHEYAEMARRLASGEGFSTGVVYPAELWLGATRDHPAVKFPPLWPALLALPFAVFGASAAVVHGVVAVTFAALVATSAALATRLAGRLAGALTTVAVATSPLLLALSLDGVSEIPFALAVTTVFLLCAREASPLWLGAACGLAYLARYNGAVLLPMVLGLLLWRRAPLPSLIVCGLAFAAVCAPWWLRNWIVTGSPFYSLLNLNLYIAPVLTQLGGSLFFQLEPDLTVGVAADPTQKALAQLPLLLLQLPYASANLAAFVGVAFACWKRDALALGFAVVAGATLVVVAFALALGRYFAPFVPVMLALGVAGWLRHGGAWRVPALTLLLAAPLLPALPAELPDVVLIRAWVAAQRASDALPPDRSAEARCLADRPRVLAQDAARVAWQHDVVAIYAPVRREDVATLASLHPVALAHLPDDARVPARGFRPRPDCGPGWYEALPAQE